MVRLPRFERADEAHSVQLTGRDLEILRQVARHRFLSSRQILSLIGGSTQHVLKRLQKLFQSGYLDRPRAQLRYFSPAGMRPIVYALGAKGSRRLSPARPPSYDNRQLKQLYLEHTLLVAEVTLAFVRSCRDESLARLLLEEDLRPAPGGFRWRVTVQRGHESKRVGVVPDRTLALEKPNGERVILFVEADRGTMPLTRRSLAQSSVQRKLLAYAATWSQALHREHLGCERFRVLVVTRQRNVRSISRAFARNCRAVVVCFFLPIRTRSGNTRD
jgi:DNA-binding Lrp family transcriptional regulator